MSIDEPYKTKLTIIQNNKHYNPKQWALRLKNN